MKLKTTNDSHIQLEIEIHKKVCTLLVYWKLYKNLTKFMFYRSVIKTTNQIYDIQHLNL